MPDLIDIDQQVRMPGGPKPAPPTPGVSLSREQIAANEELRREQVRRDDDEERHRRLVERVQSQRKEVEERERKTEAGEKRATARKRKKEGEERRIAANIAGESRQKEETAKSEDQGRVVGVTPKEEPTTKDVSAQARFRAGEGKAYQAERKQAETPKAERGIPVAVPAPAKPNQPNALKETALDMTPFYGTGRQAARLKTNWATMSNRERALDTAFTALSAVGDVTLIVGGLGLGLKAIRGASGGAKVVQSLSSSSADELAGLGRTAAKSGKPIPEVVIRGATSEQEIREAAKLADVVKSDAAFAKSSLRIENRASESGMKHLASLDDALPTGSNPKAVLRVDKPLTKAEIDAITRTAKESGVNRLTLHTEVPAKVTRAELQGIAQRTAARNNPLPEVKGPNETAEAFRARLARARANRAADTQKALADLKAGKGMSSPKAVQKSGRALADRLERAGITVERETTRLAKGGKLPKQIKVRQLVLEPPAPRGIPSAPTGRGGVGTLPRTGTGGGTSTRLRTVPGRLTIAVAGHVVGEPRGRAEPATREWTQPRRHEQPEPAPEQQPKPLHIRKPGHEVEEDLSPKPDEARKPSRLRSPGHEVELDVITDPTSTRKFRAPGHEVEDEPLPEQQGKTGVRTRTVVSESMGVKAAAVIPFKLPAGESLRRGEYPREVSWVQGDARIFRDLDTGQTRYEAYRGQTVTPRESFKVTRTDHTPPKGQRLYLGVVDVLIDSKSLRFEAHPERAEFKSKRVTRNPFRGRRL